MEELGLGPGTAVATLSLQLELARLEMERGRAARADWWLLQCDRAALQFAEQNLQPHSLQAFSPRLPDQ